MCHGAPINAFPQPSASTEFKDAVEGYHFANPDGRKVALLPDIYGCNDFYRGLATLLQQSGADVFLVDTFAGLGDLPENTREAAFARRNQVADKAFVDRFESFAKEQGIDAVIGFCLGGLYVFELARRGLDADLVGLYGFPQGLPNSDPLQVPFDYISSVTQPFTMLLGEEDASVGTENIAKLTEMAPDVSAMTLKVYPQVGHNFLPLLDSDNSDELDIARDALSHITRVAA
ncbi:dienelactone hydrolase family protein [Alterisphingorhabdus coralli]|uniref:Dienelactone hydrolase family protein n=1 Tax=Alterisphingorhabdus coralli TaxID=3071408 RepID=A0AA97I023_9SPHN|nr:dienelactone hydrolase family protein [Parasphingorhabdus sp. SCSIO 66989]WOE75349.1 dienelactone hydrolase family protein [Parasphingorhabdus sp. SCSIO 66989]